MTQLPLYTRLSVLTQCIEASAPLGTSFAGIQDAVARAHAAGAVPFEVIVGAPVSAYGGRVTFLSGDDPSAVAGAFGLDAHRWGTPRWFGIRSRGGTIAAKAYHLPGAARLPKLPAHAPHDLEIVMVATHEGEDEAYFRVAPAIRWAEMVTWARRALGGPDLSCEPEPRATRRGFGISVKWRDGVPSAISLFAKSRALPHETELVDRWSAGLSEVDRQAYLTVLAGVQAQGPAPIAGWHDHVAWTIDRERGWHRAASLKIMLPVTARRLGIG